MINESAMAQTGRRRATRREIKEAIQGYGFISPWILGFLAFSFGPLLMSLYYGFTQYTLLRPPSWIGTQNYATALFKDRIFWKSVSRTLYWSFATVPFGIIGSFFAALLLNRDTRGVTFWRICFFLPSLTPTVAASILWLWILQPDVGIANMVIRMVLGIKGPGWLANPKWALPSLAMISLWTSIGSNRMLIFLAGLQGVPSELYDAAHVDGARWWQRVRHITLPLISPTMFFNMILGVIGSLQVFGMAFVATAGGPAYATYFYALHLYQTAFKSYDMGYGSALAWLLFITILVLTLIQTKLASRWVYYAGDVR